MNLDKRKGLYSSVYDSEFTAQSSQIRGLIEFN